MAIVQEDRMYAPTPEVSETRYGAQYVKAATESPVNEPAVDEPAKEEVAEAPVAAKKAAVKKAGRPKKTRK